MTKQKSIAVWLGRGTKFIGFEPMQQEKFLNELLKHIRYNHIFVCHIARSPHRRIFRANGNISTTTCRLCISIFMFTHLFQQHRNYIAHFDRFVWLILFFTLHTTVRWFPRNTPFQYHRSNLFSNCAFINSIPMDDK